MQPWRRMFEESGAAASTIRRLGVRSPPPSMRTSRSRSSATVPEPSLGLAEQWHLPTAAAGFGSSSPRRVTTGAPQPAMVRQRKGAWPAMPHGVDLNLLGAVTTINTPRYHQIDIPTLVDCLMGRNGDPKWSAHIFSFFDEVDVSVLH